MQPGTPSGPIHLPITRLERLAQSSIITEYIDRVSLTTSEPTIECLFKHGRLMSGQLPALLCIFFFFFLLVVLFPVLYGG